MDATRTVGPPREIVLLGSTGSIGTQAADIIRRNPDRFRLTGLASGGGNPALLASQAMEFGVEVVAVASERAAPAVQQALCPRSWRARTPWPRRPRGPPISC
jgi:1-deoxy-D-xylulose-5-phosphate reductoisomerase